VTAALVVSTKAPVDICAAIDGGKRTWRTFVRYYDPLLRDVVRHASEPIRRLSEDDVDEVMGEFWLKIVEDDFRMLRAFNLARGAALLTWLTFHVSQIAHERLRAVSEEPELVPLHHARNVPDSRPIPDPHLRSEPPPGLGVMEEFLFRNIRGIVREEVRGALADSGERSPAPVAPNGADYLSVAEAAEVARLHHGTIREWIKDGSLRACRAGRVYRIRRADLHERLTAQPADPVGAEVEDRVSAILAKQSRRTG
jgi:excisionase family DNA binding protein